MIPQKRPLVRKSIALNIKTSEGKADIYHTSWLVIGLPGIGKSTLFSGFEGVLFLATSEKEVKRLKVPYILIDSWEKALEVTQELINNRSKYPQYKFIVIDFIDAVWTMCQAAVCEKLGVEHHTDAQWGKGSDTLATYFKKWVTTMIASDYGVMMVSHVHQQDMMNKGGTTTKTVCTLPKKAREVIFPLINEIGCIEYKTIKEPSRLTPGAMALNKRRVITFEGSDYIEAKDRDGAFGSAEIVLQRDPKVNFQVFKEYYEGKRKK